MQRLAESSKSPKKNNDLTEVKVAFCAERLLGAHEHVDEEHDVEVEEEGIHEALLAENCVVEDVEVVLCHGNVGLLRSKFS